MSHRARSRKFPPAVREALERWQAEAERERLELAELGRELSRHGGTFQRIKEARHERRELAQLQRNAEQVENAWSQKRRRRWRWRCSCDGELGRVCRYHKSNPIRRRKR